MKNRTSLFLLFILFLGSNAFSDTLIVCQHDTLKLAYIYQGILYNDSCDLMIDDTIYMGSDANVVLWIDEPANPFLPLINHNEKNFCHPDKYMQNYAVFLTEPGEYILNAVDTTKKQYASSFCIFKGDLSELNKSTTRAFMGPAISYQLSVPDDFKGYTWSTGENSPSVIVNEAGTYALQAANYCDETFNKNFELTTEDFNLNPFYAGKDTGEYVTYVDIEPDLIFSGHPIFDTLNLDLDNNGIVDLSFSLYHFDAMGGGSKDFSVTPLNGSEILIRDNPELVDNLAQGIIINDRCVFSDSQPIHLLTSSYSAFGGICSGGYWDNTTKFLGFKMNLDETSAFGWIRISLNSSYQFSEFIVHDYAITSETVGVEDVIAEHFRISPNPFLDNISVSNISPNTTLNIYNLLGTMVYHQNNMTKKQQINFSQFPGGIYFAEFISDDNQRQVLKIIKE